MVGRGPLWREGQSEPGWVTCPGLQGGGSRYGSPSPASVPGCLLCPGSALPPAQPHCPGHWCSFGVGAAWTLASAHTPRPNFSHGKSSQEGIPGRAPHARAHFQDADAARPAGRCLGLPAARRSLAVRTDALAPWHPVPLLDSVPPHGLRPLGVSKLGHPGSLLIGGGARGFPGSGEGQGRLRPQRVSGTPGDWRPAGGGADSHVGEGLRELLLVGLWVRQCWPRPPGANLPAPIPTQLPPRPPQQPGLGLPVPRYGERLHSGSSLLHGCFLCWCSRAPWGGPSAAGFQAAPGCQL